MPYVTQERRPALDKVVDKLVKSNIKAGDIESFLLSLPFELGWLQSYYTNNHTISNAIDEAYSANVKPNGDINYILFKYCKYHITPSYNNYKAFMGEIYDAMDASTGKSRNEFRESAEWIRIKILTPYEEKAIEKNGDV